MFRMQDGSPKFTSAYKCLLSENKHVKEMAVDFWYICLPGDFKVNFSVFTLAMQIIVLNLLQKPNKIESRKKKIVSLNRGRE